MTLCTDLFTPNCKYTYSHDTLQHSSFIDYFMFSSSCVNRVCDFTVLNDLFNNWSDHLPILAKVKLQIMQPEIANLRARSKEKSDLRLRWDLSDLSAY
jgi:hypothetical protein